MGNFLNLVKENEDVRNFLNQVQGDKSKQTLFNVALLVAYSFLVVLIAVMVMLDDKIGIVAKLTILVSLLITFCISQYLYRQNWRWIFPLALVPSFFQWFVMSAISDGGLDGIAVFMVGVLLTFYNILYSSTLYVIFYIIQHRQQRKQLRSGLIGFIQQGKRELVAEALQRGADANAADANGVPALALALALGNMEIFKLLLSHGADVSAAANATNTNGEPALVCALSNMEIFKLLLEHGANVNATDETGKTVLMRTVAMKNMEAVRLLLEKGADINAVDAQGQTPLVHAMKAKNMEAASLLLELGANVDIAKEGSELLALAAKNNDMELARTLINMGVNPQAVSQGV